MKIILNVFDKEIEKIKIDYVLSSSENELHKPSVMRPANTPRNIKKAFHPIMSGIHIIIMGRVYDSKGFVINQYAK